MDDKTKRNLEILKHFRNDVPELIFWSFRYFLGRRTIATTSFAQSLAKCYNLLDEITKETILKELEEAFKKDMEMPQYNWLGDELDKKEWRKVLEVARHTT